MFYGGYGKMRSLLDFIFSSMIFICGAISMTIAICLLYFTDFSFFGGALASPYIYKFDNQIKCAVIKGWSEQPKCYCVQIDNDERMEGAVIFIPMEKEMCENAD